MAAGLTVGCFLAAFLVLIPLPWHWGARNIPILSIIAWLFASNIIDAVNSIIWAGNVQVVAVVWCDIVTKIQIGGSMALPACCLCICIHLEWIASARQSRSFLTGRGRRMVFEAVMCWLVPFVYMALHYVVQGHRFDIVEDFGCRANTYNSVQSILLIWLPPLIAVALTFLFAGFALYHFFQRRLIFARHLQNGSSAITPSRYFRLMAMAVVQMFWGGFVLSTDVWFSVRHKLRPWISWDDVHFNFSRVDTFPLVLIPRFELAWTYVGWWSIRVSALIFFLFFAFGQDAVREYQGFVQKVIEPVRRTLCHIRRPPGDKSLFTLSDSKSIDASMDSEIKSPLPYYISSSSISSILITPGAHFYVVNDTPFSRTFSFGSTGSV